MFRLQLNDFIAVSDTLSKPSKTSTEGDISINMQLNMELFNNDGCHDRFYLRTGLFDMCYTKFPIWCHIVESSPQGSKHRWALRHSRLAHTKSGDLTVTGKELPDREDWHPSPAPLCALWWWAACCCVARRRTALFSMSCSALWHCEQNVSLHHLYHPSAAQHNLQPSATDLTLVWLPPAGTSLSSGVSGHLWKMKIRDSRVTIRQRCRGLFHSTSDLTD